VDAVAVALNLTSNDGPRSDEAHFSAHDIDQLRYLVEARTAKEPSELRDSRIMSELMMTFPFCLGTGLLLQMQSELSVSVGNHGAKFQARESPTLGANAVVEKKDGTAAQQKDERY